MEKLEKREQRRTKSRLPFYSDLNVGIDIFQEKPGYDVRHRDAKTKKRAQGLDNLPEV